MRIAIFGLGYVGAVTGACLAELGHEVIGVDSNDTKVSLINEGRSPIIEKDIEGLIKKVVNQKKFQATTDWADVVQKAGAVLVCVGTPSNPNGSINLMFVERVSEQIGQALARRKDYITIGIRSTVLPGTVEGVVCPIIEKNSQKKLGIDFGVSMIPEFLREGSSIEDFYNPPKTVIGEYDKASGDPFEKMFKPIGGPMVRTKIKVAEMVKYADNSFHALKVTFANEVGNVCKELGIDGHKVMEIFCMDDKLNLSPYYLKPGFAFGGSCLPKDVRAITYKSKMLDVDTPVLSAILPSNKRQIQKVVTKLMQYKGLKLGFLGLSFKAGTDDLRESPHVELIETMLGKGFDVKIYDENVSLAGLVGANKEYITKEIPHISSLMCPTPEMLIESSDIIVIGNYTDKFKTAVLSHVRENQIVVDLVRIVKDGARVPGEYYGICW